MESVYRVREYFIVKPLNESILLEKYEKLRKFILFFLDLFCVVFSLVIYYFICLLGGWVLFVFAIPVDSHTRNIQLFILQPMGGFLLLPFIAIGSYALVSLIMEIYQYVKNRRE